ARGEKRPTYIVLTNDSLRRIAREKPQTLGDLSRVKGIGPVKLERYGAEILALVQDEPKRRTEN
ncbi:MAG: HRDC domain-containing protein, partial [Deinococcota bacterium]|nr:HRDC domain-containing protein [Deinococcota bacterium]